MISVAKATDSFKSAECEELSARYGRAIFRVWKASAQCRSVRRGGMSG